MALTHPSYAQEKNTVANNQRLEFLGDAVLNFAVAEYLYNTYMNKAEGELTKIRARVVCERALNDVAGNLNLGQYLMLGKGEEMSEAAPADRFCGRLRWRR
jgi:ribonuclease-3